MRYLILTSAIFLIYTNNLFAQSQFPNEGKGKYDHPAAMGKETFEVIIADVNGNQISGEIKYFDRNVTHVFQFTGTYQEGKLSFALDPKEAVGISTEGVLTFNVDFKSAELVWGNSTKNLRKSK
jgi:hypothetical protein